MTRRRWIAILAAAWIATGLLGAAGANATWRHNHPEASARDCLMTRNQLVALSLTLGPVTLLIVLYAVGLVDGFTLEGSAMNDTENHHA